MKYILCKLGLYCEFPKTKDVIEGKWEPMLLTYIGEYTTNGKQYSGELYNEGIFYELNNDFGNKSKQKISLNTRISSSKLENKTIFNNIIYTDVDKMTILPSTTITYINESDLINITKNYSSYMQNREYIFNPEIFINKAKKDIIKALDMRNDFMGLAAAIDSVLCILFDNWNKISIDINNV